MKTFFFILIAIYVVDLIGFFMWALSGQTPVDGFYIGAINHYVIGSIIGLIK